MLTLSMLKKVGFGIGAITKFDTLGRYNKRKKGDSILMMFFCYKLHMELSKNKYEELILLRWKFLSLEKYVTDGQR